MLALQAYDAVVEKYVSQNPHLTYHISGPMFVNKHLDKYKGDKKTLDTSIISKLANIGHLKPHDFRRMYATYVGSSTSHLLRQYSAMAAAHR